MGCARGGLTPCVRSPSPSSDRDGAGSGGLHHDLPEKLSVPVVDERDHGAARDWLACGHRADSGTAGVDLLSEAASLHKRVAHALGAVLGECDELAAGPGRRRRSRPRQGRALSRGGGSRVPSGISSAVLLVADLLHPLDILSVEIFLNGDVRHARRGRRSMPVFLTGRDPHHIAVADFLCWTTPLLNPTGASRHDQGLTQRVGVARRPRAQARTSRGRQRRVTGGSR
jgi:hypothetical protein